MGAIPSGLIRPMRPGSSPRPTPPDRSRVLRGDVLFLLSAVLIIAAAAFGGASRENPLRLLAVELAALPLGAVAFIRWGSDKRGGTRPWGALALLGLIMLVPILQLIPLPPAIWTRLPGQSPRIEALALAGVAQPWLPISLDPAETYRAALALIPPAAMFLAAAQLKPGVWRPLAGLWIAAAAIGLGLGLGQMAEPRGGPAYLYQTTNQGSVVGLFANHNHEAAFLLALLPFAAALAAPSEGGGRRMPLAMAAFMGVAIVALGVIRSRAGVILAAPALILALLVIWRSGGGGPGARDNRRLIAGLAGAAAFAAGAVVVFGLTPLIDRFAGGAASELRFEAWPYVAKAAAGFQPFGSGLGSFDRVFEAVEPLSLVAPTYFNHAHNDYLELWLETGWAGAAIFAGFMLWLGRASLKAWRGRSRAPRAASAAALLLLAASAVDYPLRTETLAVFLAFCCGLLAAN